MVVITVPLLAFKRDDQLERHAGSLVPFPMMPVPAAKPVPYELPNVTPSLPGSLGSIGNDELKLPLGFGDPVPVIEATEPVPRDAAELC